MGSPGSHLTVIHTVFVFVFIWVCIHICIYIYIHMFVHVSHHYDVWTSLKCGLLKVVTEQSLQPFWNIHHSYTMKAVDIYILDNLVIIGSGNDCFLFYDKLLSQLLSTWNKKACWNLEEMNMFRSRKCILSWLSGVAVASQRCRASDPGSLPGLASGR